MSIKKFSESGIANRGFSGKSYTPSSSVPYVRPVDWTALPVLTEADNRFVGLHAVYEEGNFLALSAAGDYTVDWGDGVTENFAANVVAYHIYDYANANLSAVTSRGYKTAIVSLTMQSGQTFTALNLHLKHSTPNLPTYSSGFLDIAIAGSSLTDIRVGAVIPSNLTQSIGFYDLEIFNLVKSDLKQCERLLYNCYSLQEVINIDTSSTSAITTAVTFQDTGDTITAIAHGFRNGDSVVFTTITAMTGISVDTRYFIVNVTVDTFQVSTSYNGTAITLTLDGLGTVVYGVSMGYMFNGCSSLTSVPLFNTASVTNMSYMFNSCYSLTTIPLFNTASVTNMTNMFNGCSSLTSVPLFNTASVTNMSYMFNSCYSLTTIPLFNTASVTNMSYMFNGCFSLTTVPLFNTANVTSMSFMFNGCYSLTTIPLFNTANVANMSYMFNGCYSLTTVPLFNTALVANMSYMFQNCFSLTTVPLFNTANVTTMSYMFNSCYSLTTVPLFNIVSVTSMNSMFQNCYSLTTVPLFNTALVANMTNMFNGCSSLTSVPLFNTASVTNMSYMFNSCYSLTTIPLFNTASVTNMSYMFNGCFSLTTVPLFNTANVTSMSFMFNGCSSLTQINILPIKTDLSVAGCKLSEVALTVILENLDRLAAAKTFTIGTNYGAVTPISLSGTTVAGSTTVTMVNTSGITVGMQVTGTGTPTTTAIACTFTDAGDLVTKTAHGLSNGDEVSFATIVTTTGILTNTLYYVVAATAATFQVAATVGGAAIALTTNGTGTMKYKATVTAINPNVSVTLSRPATTSATNTLAFRTLKTNTAMLRGWTISG